MGAVRTGAALFAAASLPFLVAPRAARAEVFDVPSGRLGDVVIALGVRTQTTIVLAEPLLAARRSPGARGDMPLWAALQRALRGTDTEAVDRGHGVVEIRRRRVVTRPSTPSRPSPPVLDRPVVAPDIVVTASKQGLTLASYPGSVKIVEPDGGWINAHASDGTAALARLMPALGATNLGTGRNKLFIRGIADSSFSGPTQTTTGQYLGDVRLTYNAPNPDLNLYDMKRFEILEGPQGTLYGASSLGGIMRLVPNAPDVHDFSGTVSANVGITRHGAANVDGAAMLNVPVLRDRVAVRFVAFGGRAGGYIDAPLQGRRDINHTVSYGQRATLRAEDVGGWTIEAGGVVQNIKSGDGQYVLRGDPLFTRFNLIPQPFENNYRLGYASATRAVGRVRLDSVTSIARHAISSVYDATGIDGAPEVAYYREGNEITLLSHETRLSGGGRRAPWVGGVSLISSVSRLSLYFERPARPAAEEQRGGVRNMEAEVGLFGQATRPVLPSISITVGGRLTFAHGSRHLIDLPLGEVRNSGRWDIRFSGTVGASWNDEGPVTAFFHHQQGYRPGGLGIVLGDAGLTTRQFASDDLRIYEIGMRWRGGTDGRFSGQAAIFIADWRDIQADLIGDFGLPYTANIGRGIIHGLDVDVTWRPSSTLKLSASAFLNDSRLIKPAPGFVLAPDTGDRFNRTLPNVARAGGRVAASWSRTLGSGRVLRLDGAARYFGRSQLGLSVPLDVPQGDYVVGDASVRLQAARLGISLGVMNLGDAHANSFGYGNPVGIGRRDQITPLRPRTITLGVDMRF